MKDNAMDHAANGEQQEEEQKSQGLNDILIMVKSA